MIIGTVGRVWKADTSISSVAQREDQRQEARWVSVSLPGRFESDRFPFAPMGVLVLFEKRFRVSFKSLLGTYQCHLEESFYSLAKVKYPCCFLRQQIQYTDAS